MANNGKPLHGSKAYFGEYSLLFLPGFAGHGPPVDCAMIFSALNFPPNRELKGLTNSSNQQAGLPREPMSCSLPWKWLSLPFPV